MGQEKVERGIGKRTKVNTVYRFEDDKFTKPGQRDLE